MNRNLNGHKRKIFRERMSLFAHLRLVNPYFNGLYVACQVQLIFFIIYLLVRDSLRSGRFRLDFSNDMLLVGEFRDWLVFSALECVQLMLFLLMYIIFMVWQSLYSWFGKVAHLFYLAVLVSYLIGTFYLVWVIVHDAGLAMVPRLVAFIEQVRLAMKVYSFFRENSPKVLYPWHKEDPSGPAVWYAGQMSPQIGSFSQYVYFLFAPTLLYRDHYPRNNGPVKWSNVLYFASMFIGMYLVARVIFTEVQFPASMRLEDLLSSFALILLCAPLLFFIACLLLFEAWFNMTAELTRFADREFYQNWWSAVGYAEFYRLWNVPIYDYLSCYVYQELCQWMPFRSLAALTTFVLSSLAHDFFTGVSMGFFVPVFLVMFATIGGIVLVSGIKFSKFATFFFTCTGSFLFQSLFYVEIAARRYCPDDALGYFKLRSPFCLAQYHNFTNYFYEN